MAKTPYKTRPPMSLEAAVSQTFTDLGGVPAVAALPGVRVSRTTLFKYGDDAEENREHVIPMDVAAVVTAENVRRGNPAHLAQWFQEQTGPAKAHLEDHESLPDLVAKLTKEAAEVFAELAAALKAHHGRGKLTPAERDSLIRELRDVSRVACAGIETLQEGASL
jgi:hypothetical protein